MARLGKYELIRRLTTRGITERYVAREAGEAVIVYRLLPDLCGDKEIVRGFVSDARAATKLHHPNIVVVREVGKSADGYFYVGEHVRGFSLARLLLEAKQREQPMPMSLAVFIVARVCSALHEIHMLSNEEGVPFGLIHGNVQPANVLLTARGEIKLRGAGLGRASTLAARSRPDLLHNSEVAAYLSPEHVAGETPDPRSDIFSAGALLYELLCQRQLFARESVDATLKAITVAAIPALTTIDDDDLQAIVARALARERKHRYITAADMQVALDGVIRKREEPASSQQLHQQLVALFGDEVSQLQEDSVAKPPPLPAAGPIAPATAGPPPAQPPAIDDPVGTARSQADGAATAAAAVNGGARLDEGVAAPLPAASATSLPHITSLPSEPSPPVPAASPVLAAPSPLIDAKRALLLAGVLLLGALVVVLVLPGDSDGGKRAVLRIESEPSGATVYVNAKKRHGRTPLLVSDLEPGKDHHLVLMLEEHETWKGTVRLHASKEQRVQAKLAPKATAGAARLVVVAPEDARVYLDGEMRGSGTVSIDRVQPGVVHNLVVTRAGFLDRVVKIAPLRQRETRRLTIDLVPAPKPKTSKRKKKARRGGLKVPRVRGGTLGGRQGERLPPSTTSR